MLPARSHQKFKIKQTDKPSPVIKKKAAQKNSIQAAFLCISSTAALNAILHCLKLKHNTNLLSHSFIISSSPSKERIISALCVMDRRRRKQAKTETQEVSSIEWEFINMTQQEEDLIYRMYKLVGDRWELIAGRIPGRKAEEIERFWLMRHEQGFASRRRNNKSIN